MKPALNPHNEYHAHVYFDKPTLKVASELYIQIDEKFELQLGRLHKKLLGPHTKWMFQVAFTKSDYDDFIAYLELHRKGLSVLIHPLSGNNLKDHSEFASWLGTPLKLELGIFRNNKD